MMIGNICLLDLAIKVAENDRLFGFDRSIAGTASVISMSSVTTPTASLIFSPTT